MTFEASNVIIVICMLVAFCLIIQKRKALSDVKEVSGMLLIKAAALPPPKLEVLFLCLKMRLQIDLFQ